MKRHTWIITGVAALAAVIIAIVIISQFTGPDDVAKKPDDQSNQEEQQKDNNEEKEKKTQFEAEHQSFQHTDYPGEVSPKFSAEELTSPPSANWITNGGNISNGRYSQLDQINASNVADLKAEWVTSMGSGFKFKYSGESTPVVYDGVMFNITGANDVQAINAKTGEIIWEFQPELADGLDTVCCGWTSRGVAIGEGKVFVGLLDARLVALDQKTGEVLWETEVDEWEKGHTIASAPLYYDGKVYTGIAGGEYGIRGYVAAYDAEMGRQIWRTYTIPGPGEEGHETWPQDNNSWLTGGAPVWQTPAIDPELGQIYFSTGNTSPDLDGSKREGDNLFANSVVALDADTGERNWHFQEVHHDIWDLDAANPVVLFDVEMDGEMKKGIAQAGKTGWVYILDRTNGEPLIGMEEKEVPQLDKQNTSPTQPFPKGDNFVPQEVTEEDVKNDLPEEFDGKYGKLFTPFWDEPMTVKPSPQGGGNWPPSAYNPNTEYFYVLGNDNYFSYAHYADDEENTYEQGKEYLGSVWQPVENSPMRSTVTAIDIKTNKIAWQKNWDTIAYSGVLTTKGNLVFVGHNDGRIIAYDAKTGDHLWEFKTDAGANAPPITYEIDGKQYISIFSAGNSLAGTKHGDKIYTFSLEGQHNSVEDIPEEEINTSPLAEKREEHEKHEDQDSNQTQNEGNASLDQGRTIYENNCLSCHGDQGAGGHNGPSIKNSDITKDREKLIEQIKNGSGGMPPFGGTLSEDQINVLSDYIMEKLANKE
ncbi:PQQ-binding-like beta-propeller repeat protein [Virgibacillus sp. MSP4-1]|uniref:outer membrane protein assembly factor BamB family protein n=1 Tax=Virgibacillus sp. MSP4-1 TaxID=2700081 RepID=UPI0003A3F792|nr:PQQ-binding-like beta-propeller repeat protein [Virgibacillus sp. MSP4-1]QHS21744.1 PQQ-binding-like beta-propeller repeat protein [Virgibacillus sp. MSP4-1]